LGYALGLHLSEAGSSFSEESLFRRVLTPPLEFCFDSFESRGEDGTLDIRFLEVSSFVNAEFLLRRRFPPHTVKELYLFFMVMYGHQYLFFLENFVLFLTKIKKKLGIFHSYC
jgi:hypothetical protein